MELKKIHEDERGEIWGLYINGREHTIFVTKSGYARGGCIHKKSTEYCVILNGEIEYFVKDREPEIYRKGDSLFIIKNTPHYFISIEDSIVMEWGPDPEEKKNKDPEWRAIVEEINKRNKNV